MPTLQKLQFCNLLLLVLLAHYSAYLYLDIAAIVGVVLFAVLVEHAGLYVRERRLRYFSFSAMVTALGVVMMMVATHFWIYLAVVAAGLGQKHFLRLDGRHIFNPSNFALVTALLLFYREAHIVLGQLGDSYLLGALVVVSAILILVMARRWLIPVAFVLSYLLLQYYIVVLHDPVVLFEDIVLRFYSVSFVLFVAFMLTDPHTTPSNPAFQLLFAVGIALGVTLMDYYYGFRVQHLFLVLFGVSALRLIAPWQFDSHRTLLQRVAVVVLALTAIIYIQIQPPYYFEMYR